MITHANKLFLSAIFCLFLLAPPPIYGQSVGHAGGKVLRVIDGDTVELDGGDRVRLLGIDAPERGDPLYDLAADRLTELATIRPVTFEFCDERDLYGRLLATARAGEININTTMVQEGLAVPMLIPPCGRVVAEDILKAAGKGALSGRGIYSLADYRIISHHVAGYHIGENAMVRGKIVQLYKGRKAWHLNFGQDWKTDFTAVLFRDAQRRFSELGIDPMELVGSEVLVIGKLKRYNGPEIIIRGPDQVIPLEGITVDNPKSRIQNNQERN